MYMKKVVQKIKTHKLIKIFQKKRTVYKKMRTIIVQLDRPQVMKRHSARALHARYLRLQSHTQNM